MLKLRPPFKDPISIHFFSDLQVTRMTGLISKNSLISGFKNWLHYTMFVKNQGEFSLYCAFVSKLYHNTLKLSPLKWLQKCSKVVETSSDVRKSSENLTKCSGVAGTFKTKILRIWVRKSWQVKTVLITITVNRYKKLLAENHYLDPIRLQQDHHHFLESLLHCWVILYDQPE